MSYKLVVDSCCDLTEEMKGWGITVVPLTLEINDYRIMDDESFDQDDFITRMKANGGLAKSACPSPEAWKKAYEGDEDEVYVLTITDKLSGTYNSALQGKALYEEEFGTDKRIYVFNSLATAGLETIVAEKIKELADAGTEFDEVVKFIDNFIVNNTALYFCLESLDALKSNGRLFALTAKVLEKIKVKLICKRTTEGNITHLGQDLTTNRALIKMIGIMEKELEGKDLSDGTLYITYVCCKDRAEMLADKFRERMNFRRVEIIKASGLNSLYASDGGIIVACSYK